jgi:hypothetical protein
MLKVCTQRYFWRHLISVESLDADETVNISVNLRMTRSCSILKVYVLTDSQFIVDVYRVESQTLDMDIDQGRCKILWKVNILPIRSYRYSKCYSSMNWMPMQLIPWEAKLNIVTGILFFAQALLVPSCWLIFTDFCGMPRNNKRRWQSSEAVYAGRLALEKKLKEGKIKWAATEVNFVEGSWREGAGSQSKWIGPCIGWEPDDCSSLAWIPLAQDQPCWIWIQVNPGHLLDIYWAWQCLLTTEE